MEALIAELQAQRAFLGDRAANLAQELGMVKQQLADAKAEIDRLKEPVEENSSCDNK